MASKWIDVNPTENLWYVVDQEILRGICAIKQ